MSVNTEETAEDALRRTAQRVLDLQAWIEGEQEQLWGQLHTDIRMAQNGAWSMACAGTAARIVSAARLVGPTSSDKIQWTLLAGGIWETLLDSAEIPHEALDLDGAEWTRMMERHGNRAMHQFSMARTLEYMKRPAEVRFIRGED
jgi:hypothetical protein